MMYSKDEIRKVTGNLRNGLAAILALVELAKDDGVLTKEQRKYLNQTYFNDICQSGVMMTQLAQQLETRHLN